MDQSWYTKIMLKQQLAYYWFVKYLVIEPDICLFNCNNCVWVLSSIYLEYNRAAYFTCTRFHVFTWN